MINDLVIAKLDSARLALYEAKTIQDTKQILDVAAAAEIYARRQQLGEESVKYATEIKLEAMRQLGRMLAEMPKNKGAKAGKSGIQRVPLLDDTTPTLSALGISKKVSSLSQQIAALPDETFEQVKEGIISITEARREIIKENVIKNVQLPTEKYRIIYADPPWSYNDKCTAGAVQAGGAERHYPSMSISELCAMPIKEITTENAVLFLWTTSPLLEECFQVISAWGFKYKASFIWDKIKHNMGHYNSVRHEFLLICTRGSCTPDNVKLFDSVQSIERTEKHSQKPNEFRNIIDTLYPHGKRIELFAREKTDNWDVYGNQL